MALLTAQSVKPGGTDITFVAAAAGGDTFAMDLRGIFAVKNGGASPISVTIAIPGTDEFEVARADITKSVAAGAQTHFGPFPRTLMDPTTKVVSVAYSGVTSVTVALMSLS